MVLIIYEEATFVKVPALLQKSKDAIFVKKFHFIPQTVRIG